MENFNDSKALAIEIAKILDKKKAHDVRVLKVESLTVLTDYFVIASGTSTTQVASLADEVEFELSQKGLEPYSTEGYDSKNWVLLDYSNVIVHQKLHLYLILRKFVAICQKLCYTAFCCAFCAASFQSNLGF